MTKTHLSSPVAIAAAPAPSVHVHLCIHTHDLCLPIGASPKSTTHQKCLNLQVAALAGLAQDLPLERVLPNDFRPLFQSIKDQVKPRWRTSSCNPCS